MDGSRIGALAPILGNRLSRRRLLRAARYGAAWLPPVVLLQQTASCGDAAVAIEQCPSVLRVGEAGPLEFSYSGPAANSPFPGQWRLEGDDGAVATFLFEEGGPEIGDTINAGSSYPVWLRAKAPGTVTVTISVIFEIYVLFFPFTLVQSDSCAFRILPAESTGTPQPEPEPGSEPEPPQHVRLSDRDFDPANWEVTVEATGGATQEATQVDGYRRMVHRFPGTGKLVARHVYVGAGYDPGSHGAIDRIDYGEDRIVIDPPRRAVGVGAAALLAQDGVFYVAQAGPGEFVNTEWTRARARGLRSEDFRDAGGNHPDFSASGAPIRMGYLRSNKVTSGEAFVIEHGIDDWVVTIHRA